MRTGDALEDDPTWAKRRLNSGSPAWQDLVARVNARKTYWASHAANPGGAAWEKFELVAPFRPGQEFVFGITPDLPTALGFLHRQAPPKLRDTAFPRQPRISAWPGLLLGTKRLHFVHSLLEFRRLDISDRFQIAG